MQNWHQSVCCIIILHHNGSNVRSHRVVNHSGNAFLLTVCKVTERPHSFLFRIITSCSTPPEVGAFSSWCLAISMLSCRPPGFLWSGSLTADQSETLLSSGFFLHVQFSIGCFPPSAFTAASMRSLHIIHFFRNTLQTNWASGETHTKSYLWFATLGDFYPFTSFWVIYETSID